MDFCKAKALGVGTALVAAIGSGLAAYLAASHLLGAASLCGAGCSTWYLDGPLSSIGGIPTAAFGLATWIVLALSCLGSRPHLLLAGGFAVGALTLQAAGLIATRSICPWCLTHAAACVAYAGFAWRSGTRAPIATVIAAGFFGAGYAVTLPHELTSSSEVRRRALQIPVQDLRAAAVPLFGPLGTRSELFVFADMECGHCRRWLRQASSRKPKEDWSVGVIFATLNPTGEQGANAIAQAYAGSPETLRAYLQDNPRLKSPRPADQAAMSAALFRRLNLRAVPLFVAHGTSPSTPGSTQAWDLVFPSE